MTAQYRPYRDEETYEDGQEASLSSWDTQEPGTIQIYEKTTQDLPIVQQRRFFAYAIILVIISLLIGFMFGQLNTCTSCNVNDSTSHRREESVNVDWSSSRQLMHRSIDPSEMKDFLLHYLSKTPRLPSSPSDSQAVKVMYDYFIKYNLDKIEFKNYSVLVSLPNEKQANFVQIQDIHSNQVVYDTLNDTNSQDSFFQYSAYSPARSVRGDVVFVNYGQAADYKVLREMGIDVHGKIHLAKQMNVVADEQAQLAEREGAIGLLLYPDPLLVGNDFPEDAVRRDSLLWNNLGDPQTPGYPSTASAYRIPHDLIQILPKIPVQPITLSAASQILILLSGEKGPDNWIAHTNSSSFDLHVGPAFRNSNLTLNLTVNNILEERTIVNLCGLLRGHREPDRYVIVGNHRDSWSSGVLDSAGGTAGFLQLVKVFSTLSQQNHRPHRSILFCSWGSEELNLIGSSEWIEEYTKILQARAIAYINTDILAVGTKSLAVTASPLLFNVIFNATQRVSMPHSSHGTSVYDAWLQSYPVKRDVDQLLFTSSTGKEFSLDQVPNDTSLTILNEYIKLASVLSRPKVRRLDMRSVCAPFFAKAGIPSIELTFVPSAGDVNASAVTYPLIHTQYDDINLLNKFDQHMEYHSTATKIIGEIIFDLTHSTFIPFNLLEYAQILKDFFVSLRIHSTIFTSIDLDLKLLESAINNFTRAAVTFHSSQSTVDTSDELIVRQLNDKLIGIERTFLDHSGLPRNPSKKHLILSPSESVHSYFDEMFPGLMDEFTLILHAYPNSQSQDILKAHFSILIYTVQSAADFLTSF